MRSSDLIARCLENEGVRYVFGVPGEEILDIVDSLADSSVRFVPTRHEQGAGFMADASGRLTGPAQAGRDRIHNESHQYLDIVEHMRPLTKWNTRAEMPVVIPEVIRKAFKVAEAEKPGACHGGVPE